MKHIIEINNERYTIKNRYDLTIDKHTELDEILETNNYNGLLHLLSNIPSDTIKFISTKYLELLDWKMILNDTDNVKYKVSTSIINFDEISLSKFIDIDYFLSDGDKDYLAYIYALLIKNEYKSMLELKEAVEKIKKDLLIKDIIGTVTLYTNWRKNITNKFATIFENNTPTEEDDDEITFDEATTQPESADRNFGMLGLVYHFTTFAERDGVLKDTLLSFLNWLTWKYQEIEKEVKAQKKNNRTL